MEEKWLEIAKELEVLATKVRSYATACHLEDEVKNEEENLHKTTYENTHVITEEEIRTVLIEKMNEGKRLEIKRLINQYGVNKLSMISSEYYEELLEQAKML